MRYLALAADYDGTLAHDGHVSATTVEALHRLKRSGRRLVMVTGRELPELLQVCPAIDLFDRVVAENGALLYRPDDRQTVLLADPPPPEFAAELRRRAVEPFSVGQVIVATREPHQNSVFEVIQAQRLALQVIFNKGAVMVLPSGVNKATGLKAALDDLGLSPHNAVGVGDAENDHALLALCECAVTVQNALDTVKARADWVTDGARGDGVAQLIDRMIEDDLASLDDRLVRHHLLIGTNEAGAEERIPPHGRSILVAGTSGSGKSSFATALLERLAEARYQFVFVGPAEHVAALERAVVLGEPDNSPTLKEVVSLLEQPEAQNAVVDLTGIGPEDRPAFCGGLLARLQALRSRLGRPHWALVDDAHHLLPANRRPDQPALSGDLGRLLLITDHPAGIAPELLETVERVLALGSTPAKTIAEFCQARGLATPSVPPTTLETGELLSWPVGDDSPLVRIKAPTPRRGPSRPPR